MKAGIHPDYQQTDIVCACGAVYHTRSTRPDIRIGICAACHPFFTGEQKFVDTAGRVEKFARRYGSTKAVRTPKKGLGDIVAGVVDPGRTAVSDRGYSYTNGL